MKEMRMYAVVKIKHVKLILYYVKIMIQFDVLHSDVIWCTTLTCPLL
jgi:hypothetical protein